MELFQGGRNEAEFDKLDFFYCFVVAESETFRRAAAKTHHHVTNASKSAYEKAEAASGLQQAAREEISGFKSELSDSLGQTWLGKTIRGAAAELRGTSDVKQISSNSTTKRK